MGRTGKRILIVGSIVFAGMLAFVYFYVFAPSGAAIRHAEEFRFRRMTVAQLGDQGTFRHFFISNRGIASQEAPVLERFSNQREESITFGFFDARIEPSLGLGMFINPTQWFQDEEIRLDNVATLEQAAFVAEVRAQVDRSPYGSLLIVVHGFREEFPSALRKTAFVGHVLDINSPVLVFDWPGDQGVSVRGYRRARDVAEASGTELARTVELITREVAPERLWILANSMGAQVVADAFGVLYQNPDMADPQTEIEDVVLTAPDVDREELDSRFREEITAMARQLTVYVSSNDRALLVSRLVNRSPRGGESTLSPDMLEEAIRIADLVQPDDQLITLVDVTPVNRTRNFHNFSLETPEFYDDLFLRLTNDKTPRSRPIYRVRAPDGDVYWVLTRAR